MERIHLTKAIIDALPIPARGKREYCHDAKVRGLAICVTWTGLRTWYVQRWAAGKSQRIRLGEYPSFTIGQARDEAERRNAEIASGVDPSAGVRARREQMTFREAFDWYIENHSRPRKLSSARDEERFRNHLGPLAGLMLSAVTRARLRELHTTIGAGPGIYAANRTLALVSVMFSRLLADDLFNGPNPAAGIEPFRESSRERRLSPGEVKALFDSIGQEPSEAIRDYIWLSLYTGARRANVLAMRWDDIDQELNTWRIPVTKNGLPQIIPLGTEELEILNRRRTDSISAWVFPGRVDGTTGHMSQPAHGWARVVKRAGIKDLRLHDLRRTLGSWMVDTGASLAIVGKTLGHQSHESTAIYARLSLDPVRDAKGRAISAMIDASKKTDSPPSV